MSAVLEVTDTTFQQEVIDSQVLTVVDFWAPWCMPCRMIAPVIDELKREYGDRVNFVKVNTDESHRVASQYGIMSIPTLLFFKNGEIVHHTIGVQPAASLKREIDRFLTV